MAASGAPKILIDESDVGPRPLNDGQLTDIGLVGLFPFGKKNVPTLVTSLADAVRRFAPQYAAGASGIPSLYGIYAQNARARVWVVNIDPTSVADVAASKTLSNAVPTVIATSTAVSGGPEYNNVLHEVLAASDGNANHWNLRLTQQTTGQVELWENLNTFTGSDNNLAAAGGPSEPNAGSKWVTVAKIANGRPVNSSAPMANGTLGTAQDSDYVGTVSGASRTGLHALDTVPTVRYIVTAQQTSPTVQSGLEAYVEARTVDDGTAIGLAFQPAGTSYNSASNGSLDSARMAMFYGAWISAVGPTELQNTLIIPDGHVAGTISKYAAHRSPANKEVFGLVSPQYALRQSEVDALSDVRINAVAAIPSAGIRIRSGWTTSSDTAWREFALRNQYDRMERILHDGLFWAVAEPDDPDTLWPQVAAQCNGFLERERVAGAIIGYLPTVVDDTNNSDADVEAGELNVDVRFRPAFPANYINLRLSRVRLTGSNS
jgi:phage tail sheath protein FI